MNISELISCFEEIKEQYGDLPVYIDDDINGPYPIEPESIKSLTVTTDVSWVSWSHTIHPAIGKTVAIIKAIN